MDLATLVRDGCSNLSLSTDLRHLSITPDRRELGGDIPSTIDIQVPVLGTRVTLEVPQLDVGEGFEGYGSLTPQRILSVCQEALGSFPSYESLIQAEIERGAQLGLAWHRGMNLDWVWLESDVNGSRRDWAVLYGLALKQVSGIFGSNLFILIMCLGDLLSPRYIFACRDTNQSNWNSE